MSEIKESNAIENLPDPIKRRVDIKDESNDVWERRSFGDLTRGVVFRIIGDPTVDGILEWTATSDIYPDMDGVLAIDAQQNVHP